MRNNINITLLRETEFMFYFHVSVVIIALLICYKWGDWRHWEKYYSTILFFMIGDFIYLVLFRKTMLWTYNTDILNHTLVNLLVLFTVYPATILLFIPYFPKHKHIVKKAGYILLWVALFGTAEYVSHSLGFFNYHNGWNCGWSIIFSAIMFPLQYLHYHKPLLAWGLALVKLVTFISIFNVDIMSLI
jgi:hypothetical protein